MSPTPKLRTSRDSIHPLNKIPRQVVLEITKHLAFLEYMGVDELTGDEWARIFAKAVHGAYKKSMSELPDVIKNSTFWSAKTIRPAKTWNPSKDAVIISGRNNLRQSYPDLPKKYDFFEKPDETGKMILEIWNERVKLAKQNISDGREIVLIRNQNLDSFILYEKELIQYNPEDYTWKKNNRGNLWGYDSEGNNRFRWQVSTQFTIVEPLPSTFIHFTFPKHGKRILLDEVLKVVGYSSKSVTIEEVNKESANGK